MSKYNFRFITMNESDDTIVNREVITIDNDDVVEAYKQLISRDIDPNDQEEQEILQEEVEYFKETVQTCFNYIHIHLPEDSEYYLIIKRF